MFSAWSNPFAALGSDFFTPLQATPVPAPYWVATSTPLAGVLGIHEDLRSSHAWLQTLSGNTPIPNVPSGASVYSGHQFGVWAGQLGDGRALLLGKTAGLEVQLKGAGRTPYSRSGDGRALLRSSIREFLCSEAMHSLGVPTSRALSIVGSDMPVRREDIETAAIVTRVAPSFIRFGHFEHFCHTQQHTQLKVLADYVIDSFYPECRSSTHFSANPYANLLHTVTHHTADLLAHWQALGFCHGVMNTDNMSILGLTLDYGPFQFLDAYDPHHICNHSDTTGRYAFHKQPNIAYWNLFCLGQALLPLIESQELAISALETYRTIYPDAFAQRMAQKLGFTKPSAAISALIAPLLQYMAQDRVDYTIFWRRLSHWAQERTLENTSVHDLFVDREAIHAWLHQYVTIIAHNDATFNAASMLRTNPQFILRNHLGELAIAAAKNKDFSLVDNLLHVLETPFSEHLAHAAWADAPPEWASDIRISCSS